jgi:hypothetical protein
MCACTETDVRESANDCIIASGEGHGRRAEKRRTRFMLQVPFPHRLNTPYYYKVHNTYLKKFLYKKLFTIILIKILLMSNIRILN